MKNSPKLHKKLVLRCEMYPEFLFFGPPQAPLNGIRFSCQIVTNLLIFLKKNNVISKKIAAGVRVKCAFDLSVFFGSAKNRPVFDLSVRST